MADPALNGGPEAAALKERERFAQIPVCSDALALKRLSARLGLESGEDRGAACSQLSARCRRPCGRPTAGRTWGPPAGLSRWLMCPGIP